MVDAVANARARYAALSALFDAGTRQHLLDRELAPGWRCLEVGAGGGSIARWLGQRVGPTGRVIATDARSPRSILLAVHRAGVAPFGFEIRRVAFEAARRLT